MSKLNYADLIRIARIYQAKVDQYGKTYKPSRREVRALGELNKRGVSWCVIKHTKAFVY